MVEYPALSIAQPVAHLLRAGRFAARVLAVFDRVCDLVTDKGEVIALVTPQVSDGPLNIVVDASPGVWAGIEAKQYVETDGALIRMGHVAVDVRSAAVWEPCPAWARLALHRDNITTNVAYLATWLTGDMRLPPDGLTALLYPQLPSSSRPSELVLRTAHQATQALLAAIASSDCARAGEAAAHLAGLGGGLTPAGDDFLIGLMAWLWLSGSSPHPGQPHDGLCSAIARAASGKTTTLSQALLGAAARGEFSSAWHALLGALAGGDVALVEGAAQRMLAYGHTSGADALAGFVLAATQG